MDQVEDLIQFMIEHLQNASLEVRLIVVDRCQSGNKDVFS